MTWPNHRLRARPGGSGFPSSFRPAVGVRVAEEKRYPMELLLIIVILLFLFGGFGLSRR